MQNNSQTSYNDIANADLSAFIYDTVELHKNGIDSIQQPVITKDCLHIKSQELLSFQDAVNQINSPQRYAKCQCGKIAKSKADLRKDIRGIAKNKFHPITQTIYDQIQIIQGILTHKYTRKLIYTGTVSSIKQESEHARFVSDLYNKYHETNSISSLILKQGFQGSYYDLWAYCLLDKIKIIIPTRIIGCLHPACYELTSLLFQQKHFEQNREDSQMIIDNNDTSIIFYCKYPGCENKIDIQTLPIMLSKLFIDQELLNLLNSAPSIQFKFTYDLQKKCFLTDFKNRDPYILDIYPNIDDNIYNSIMIQIQSIIQSTTSEDIQEKLNQQKYQIRKINLIDPLNGKYVEFPVRCIKCKDDNDNRCVDIRTYTAYFYKTKVKKGTTEQIKCPICESILETKTSTLNNLIYFDQNIISRMFKDTSANDFKQFDYNGKLYMLEEFLSKQKFSKTTYTQILKQKKSNNGDYIKEVEFSSLKCIIQYFRSYCIVNPTRKLQYPLIIKNCSKNSYIDFESFYEKMVECKFKIPEGGLRLCLCQEYCSKNPVKKYQTSVFYHEALGDALKLLGQEGFTPQKFKYNFEEGKFILMFTKSQTSDTINQYIIFKKLFNIMQLYINQLILKYSFYYFNGMDNKIIRQGRFNVGFIDLLTDEEYVEAFKTKTVIGGKYQLIGMSYDVIEGLKAEHTAQGLKMDVEGQVQQINQNASQELKQYQFQLTGMKVEMKNDVIRINKGEISSQNYKTD